MIYLFVSVLSSSASFNSTSGECALSDMDRFSVTARSAYSNSPDVDYFETNCVDDPVKMCDFQRSEGRILKTVDAVHQVNVQFKPSVDMCYRLPHRLRVGDREVNNRLLNRGGTISLLTTIYAIFSKSKMSTF